MNCHHRKYNANKVIRKDLTHLSNIYKHSNWSLILHNATYALKILCNASNFNLYISCSIASFHQQNQHSSSTGCITTANSYIKSVAEIRQTSRHSAKKCRVYHQEIYRRLHLVALTVAYSYRFLLQTAIWKRANWNIKVSVYWLFCVLTKHGIWHGKKWKQSVWEWEVEWNI
jgi:hypothetical protein